MCYYMGVKVSYGDFIRLKQLEKIIPFGDLNRPVQNGFDYRDWPVIKPNAEYCDWEIVMMEWGFAPSYLRNRQALKNFRRGYKDANGKFQKPMTTLNAIGHELLLPDKMYREAALKRRCLVLYSSFYEWQHIPKKGKKGQDLEEKVKHPYNVGLKDQKYFFTPAVWNTWTDRDTGETVDTFASCTTWANSIMRQIHNSKNRMPTILTEELAAEWISDGLTENRIIELATYQIPTNMMRAHTIRKDFLSAADPAEEFFNPEVKELIWD